MFGLGTPEIVLIAIGGAIFFFGLPKVKEWRSAFEEKKAEATEVLNTTKSVAK